MTSSLRVFSFPLFSLCLVLTLCGNSALQAQEISSEQINEQRNAAKQIDELIDRAGALFKQGEYEECGREIDRAYVEIGELLAATDKRLYRVLQAMHEKVSRASQMLQEKNVATVPIGKWSDLVRLAVENRDEQKPAAMASQDTVDFGKQLAPWMVEKCGACHINRSRGNFSMATIGDLANGANGRTVIFPGDPIASRLVDVIETGDMPRGGGRVTADELNLLKAWIQSGAKIDFPPNVALADFSKSRNAEPPQLANGMVGSQVEPMESSGVTRPQSGQVSFGADVAPILAQNCNGCHIGGNRNSGGFGMNNFAQLLAGGDSGVALVAKNPEQSLLIRKMTGMAGQRMPAGGRPPLEAGEIELISKWVEQGIPFDGESKEQSIQSVIDASWVANASQEQLRDRVVDSAVANWQRVIPNGVAEKSISENYVLVGNLTNARLGEIEGVLRKAERAAFKLMRTNRANCNLPTLLPIYVFKSRYDYAEFGKMVENRGLPYDWTGHFRRQGIDSYLVITEKTDEAQLEAQFVQLLTATMTAGYQEVPDWFAAGAGRFYSYRHDKKTPDAEHWQRAFVSAVRQLRQPDDLLKQRLGEDESALIGFGIIRFLAEGPMRKRSDVLWRHLQRDMPFEEAFKVAIGELPGFLEEFKSLPHGSDL